MNAEPHLFRATCDWCHTEVVSYLGPARLSHVHLEWPIDGVEPQDFGVCGNCHADFIKWIARRHNAQTCVADHV